MKIRIIITFFALIVSAASCTGRLEETVSAESNALTATITSPVPFATKAIDKDFKFGFVDGDHLSIGNAAAGQTYMNYAVAVDPENPKKCDIQINGFNLTNDTYSALYPMTSSSTPSNILFPLTGQVQNGNGTADHLSAFDCNFATAEITNNIGNFAFKHKVAWIKFELTFAENEDVQYIKLKGADNQFASAIKVNLPDGTATPQFDASEMVLTLKDGTNDFISVTAGTPLVAYMTLPGGVDLDRFNVLVKTTVGEEEKYKELIQAHGAGSHILDGGKYVTISKSYVLVSPSDFMSKVNGSGTNLSGKTVIVSGEGDINAGTTKLDPYTNMTIDLNGHKFTTNCTGGSSQRAIWCKNEVTIKNGSLIGDKVGTGMPFINATTNAKLTLENVSIHSTGIPVQPRDNANAVLNVYNCVIDGTEQANNTSTYAYNTAIGVSSGSTANIYGGVFKGRRYAVSIYTSGGKINIYGGEFIATNNDSNTSSICMCGRNNGGSGYVNIYNDNSPRIHGDIMSDVPHPNYIVINGGIFDEGNGCKLTGFRYNNNETYSYDSELFTLSTIDEQTHYIKNK